jgi:hypothetical protein
MKVMIFLLLTVAFVAAQTAYPPGINLMIDNGITDKVRTILIPDIMQGFGTIEIGQTIAVQKLGYKLRLYGLKANGIKPLKPEQITIIMDEKDNSLYVKITGFQTEFSGRALLRFAGTHNHGSCRINVKIDTVIFKVTPRLIADGDLNQLDYHLDKVQINVNKVVFESLHIGKLPSALTEPMANLALATFKTIYSAFEKQFGRLVKSSLNDHTDDIPDALNIATDLNISLSFPNVPRLSQDQIRIPFDGSIFQVSKGYNTTSDQAPAMPDYNPKNPNNVQVFLNQHVLSTAINTIKKSGMAFTVNTATLASLDLPDNFMTVRYFSMLFPKLACNYTPDVLMQADLSIDPTLNTEVTFAPNKLHGSFSPKFTIKAGKDVALAISFTLSFDSTINFEVKGLETFATGSLNTVSISNFAFVAGTVKETDLGEILETFDTLVTPLIISAANGFLGKGITIPVIPLIKDVFEIDIDDILLELKDKYLEASFTLDIYEKMRMIRDLLKIYE